MLQSPQRPGVGRALVLCRTSASRVALQHIDGHRDSHTDNEEQADAGAAGADRARADSGWPRLKTSGVITAQMNASMKAHAMGTFGFASEGGGAGSRSGRVGRRQESHERPEPRMKRKSVRPSGVRSVVGSSRRSSQTSGQRRAEARSATRTQEAACGDASGENAARSTEA